MLCITKQLDLLTLTVVRDCLTSGINRDIKGDSYPLNNSQKRNFGSYFCLLSTTWNGILLALMPVDQQLIHHKILVGAF